MDVYIIVALAAAALLLAEAVLPTGGFLGTVGVVGFFAAGVIGIAEGGSTADAVGAALIALAIVSAIALWFVARKVYDAHRNTPPQVGPEEMLGGSAEARTDLDPTGQVFIEGSLWAARLVTGAEPVRAGDKVIVEAVDGLTLVVRPQPQPVQSSGGGG